MPKEVQKVSYQHKNCGLSSGRVCAPVCSYSGAVRNASAELHQVKHPFLHVSPIAFSCQNRARQVELLVHARTGHDRTPEGVGINQRSRRFIHEFDKFVYCSIIRERYG